MHQSTCLKQGVVAAGSEDAHAAQPPQHAHVDKHKQHQQQNDDRPDLDLDPTSAAPAAPLAVNHRAAARALLAGYVINRLTQLINTSNRFSIYFGSCMQHQLQYTAAPALRGPPASSRHRHHTAAAAAASAATGTAFLPHQQQRPGSSRGHRSLYRTAAAASHHPALLLIRSLGGQHRRRLPLLMASAPSSSSSSGSVGGACGVASTAAAAKPVKRVYAYAHGTVVCSETPTVPKTIELTSESTQYTHTTHTHRLPQRRALLQGHALRPNHGGGLWAAPAPFEPERPQRQARGYVRGLTWRGLDCSVLEDARWLH